MNRWRDFLLVMLLAALVAAYGEPKPTNLIVAGLAAITAVYGFLRDR